MKMSMDLMIVGAFCVFLSAVGVAVVWPIMDMRDTAPSDIFRTRTEDEVAGRELYVANGCTNCHSQAVRWSDWGLGAERVAQMGDYISDRPHLLGSERTGPDLSQEGGEHPDEWHEAHFFNPRWTRPESIMPPYEFFSPEDKRTMIAYVQSLGFKNADARVARQDAWKHGFTRADGKRQKGALEAFEAGTDANVRWLHDNVPEPWRDLPNPYPSSLASLQRGMRIYQSYCIGCHGEVGDGMGKAAQFIDDPPPLNFTTLKNRLGPDFNGRGRADKLGGIFYYQIMNGITGTAMPYFKRDLESEKIWAVGEYVARYFVGVTDADGPPEGIDAAYEPPRGEPIQ